MQEFIKGVHLGAGLTVGVIVAVGWLMIIVKAGKAAGIFPLPF